MRLIRKIIFLILYLKERPPRIIVKKIVQKIQSRLRRAQYWKSIESSNTLFFKNKDRLLNLRNNINSGSGLLVSIDERIKISDYLKTNRPDYVNGVLREADIILDGKFKIFGDKVLTKVGPDFWVKDHVTGFVWPKKHHTRYDTHSLDSTSDVKIPWELSRFNFVSILGQSYWFTKKKKYADFFVSLVEDWQQENPVGYSINWATTMEVALRGANIALGLEWFGEVLSESDLGFLSGLIASHSIFTEKNLEYTDIRGNHYAGNIAGLGELAAVLKGAYPRAERWLDLVEMETNAEVPLQFLPDGVGFEKSIPYHRLAVEMFLITVLVLRKQNRPVSKTVIERLKNALMFIAAYTRPDGLVPVWGDNDDARFMPINLQHLRDHRYLLSWGALVLDDHELAELAPSLSEEAIWTTGLYGLERFANMKKGQNKTLNDAKFATGGFYITKNNGNYLIVDAGEVGLAGRGGHGHLDILSFELCLDGTPLIVDPGSYVYTVDYKARNMFRSTGYHNIIRIDRKEMAVLNEHYLFRLGNEAEPGEISFLPGNEETYFSGSHKGYLRMLKSPVKTQREIWFHKTSGKIQIRDTLSGDGVHEVESFFHLASGVRANQLSGNEIILKTEHHSYILVCKGDDEGRFGLETGWISEAYGHKEESAVVVWRRHAKLPFSWTTEIYREE